jgi:hypothetical protein
MLTAPMEKHMTEKTDMEKDARLMISLAEPNSKKGDQE